jgi:hypothetical protein
MTLGMPLDGVWRALEAVGQDARLVPKTKPISICARRSCWQMVQRMGHSYELVLKGAGPGRWERSEPMPVAQQGWSRWG